MNKNDTVTIIRSLLSSTNSSCSIYKLNADFKSETGVDIPLFDYENITDFLNSIPETVKVSGIYPIQRVSLVANEKSGHIASLVSRQRSGKPKKISVFKSKSGSRKFPLDTRINGFEKETICKEPIVECLEEETHETYEMLTSSSAAEFGQKSIDMSIPLTYTNRSVSLNNCLGPGENVTHVNLELHAQIGGYVEVYPCHIVSPHKFYFQFRKLKKKFSDFMDKLQVFYATRNIPEVGDEALTPKLICAVFHKIQTEPVWHRAEILQVVRGFYVKVKLIDHGIALKVPRENLKRLHKDFGSLPRQAVLGSLANIRPRGESDWSSAAVERFSELSCRKDLVAGVVHIDPQENSMSVALSSTRALEIHINDTLVEEGFAEFDRGVTDSWNISKTRNSNKYLNSILNESTKKYNEPVEPHVSPEVRAPLFYFSDNYSNNNRLKKMFSLG